MKDCSTCILLQHYNTLTTLIINLMMQHCLRCVHLAVKESYGGSDSCLEEEDG